MVLTKSSSKIVMAILLVCALVFTTLGLESSKAHAKSTGQTITLSYSQVKDLRTNLKDVKKGAKLTAKVVKKFGTYGKISSFLLKMYKDKPLTDALDKAYKEKKRLKMTYVYGITMSTNYYKYEVIK
ncbi:hypothetical protein ABER68_24110 [Paenibacillus alvei]